MTFFDTNVLVYSTVNLDKVKQEISDRLIETAIKKNIFTISTLVVSEFYVLSKLKIDNHLVEEAIYLYKPFVKHTIKPLLVFEAYNFMPGVGNW